jgi:hypothetical protein
MRLLALRHVSIHARDAFRMRRPDSGCPFNFDEGEFAAIDHDATSQPNRNRRSGGDVFGHSVWHSSAIVSMAERRKARQRRRIIYLCDRDDDNLRERSALHGGSQQWCGEHNQRCRHAHGRRTDCYHHPKQCHIGCRKHPTVYGKCHRSIGDGSNLDCKRFRLQWRDLWYDIEQRTLCRTSERTFSGPCHFEGDERGGSHKVSIGNSDDCGSGFHRSEPNKRISPH